jgi:hypothetical protein
LIGLAGAVLAVVGIGQFVIVARRAYATEIQIEPQTEFGERMTHFLARYGYSARGVILCVLAWFLLDAAINSNPKAVGDTDTAFDFIGGGIVGDTAFAVVALGTVAYGVFMYLNAWHYKFDSTPEPVDAAEPVRRSDRLPAGSVATPFQADRSPPQLRRPLRRALLGPRSSARHPARRCAVPRRHGRRR